MATDCLSVCLCRDLPCLSVCLSGTSDSFFASYLEINQFVENQFYVGVGGVKVSMSIRVRFPADAELFSLVVHFLVLVLFVCLI